MARRDFPRSSFDAINVTPLIDTLFFLLIIFMITAPLLEYSVDVSPPEMNASTIEQNDNSAMINVKADGQIVFDRQEVSDEELSSALQKRQLDPVLAEAPLFIRADRELRYGRVMDVMKIAKDAGFKNVQLVVTEEAK